MKRNQWIPVGVAALTAALTAGCGGGAARAAGPVANPARSSGGAVLRTQGTGQAVSAVANNRFQTAARAMRQHDEANGGRGDWVAGTCNDVAGQFESAANEQPGGAFAEAWFNRGLVFDRCSMAEPARTAFQRAIDVSAQGNFCRARSMLAVYQMRANQTADALATLENAIRLDRNCVEAYANRATILRERNQGNDRVTAVGDIRQALARDDAFIPALNQLALIYLAEAGDDPHSQRLMLAGIVCSQAAQLSAGQREGMTPAIRGYIADVYNTWGLIDIRSGQIIRALGHFQRAYESNPSMFEAWANYGTINLSFRGYADARIAFEHAIALRGNDYDTHIGLGIALRGIGAQDLGRALERQNQAQPLENQGNTAGAARLRAEAQALLARGNPLLEQARAEYERAHALDGSRPDYYYNLGLLSEGYINVLAPDRIPDLDLANRQLQDFIQRAGASPRYADAVTRATSHRRNNLHAIDELCALFRLNSAGALPATFAICHIDPNQRPIQPATPPAGATPPAAGAATPPAGGAATPPAAGATPPAGAAATPPAAGATPATPPAAARPAGAH